jgi:acyl-CoA thioester hydrolase
MRVTRTVDTAFHVRYAETDAMGIVHHASYLIWFEEGRSAYMRACGLPYSEVERHGYWFTVAEVNARFHAPARYDERVIVRTRLAELRSRGLTFAYEVRRAADDTLLATGETRHICVDRTGVVRRIPEALLAALRGEEQQLTIPIQARSSL